MDGCGVNLKVDKMLRTNLISICMMFLLLLGTVSASSSEYLFPNESISKTLSKIIVDDKIYTLYAVTDGSSNDIIILSEQEIVPSHEETIEKTLFSYNTQMYVIKNQVAIAQDYKRTYNQLDDRARSLSQQILNLFKEIKEQCAPIPYLKIISVCVKPSDKLLIMKIGKAGDYIPDWDMALTSYNLLGGKVLYLIDTTEPTKYDVVLETHYDFIAMYEFLNTVSKITNTNIIKSDVMTTSKIIEEVSKNTEEEKTSIKERINLLSETEKTKYNNANNKLDEIKVGLTP